LGRAGNPGERTSRTRQQKQTNDTTEQHDYLVSTNGNKNNGKTRRRAQKLAALSLCAEQCTASLASIKKQSMGAVLGRTACLEGIVRLAKRGELVAVVSEDVLAGHEVGVALQAIEVLEEGNHRVEEVLLLLNGAGRAKL
jgi:hypothetical protein